MSSDSVRRFSDRVENYVRYRPGYPPAVLPFLGDACGLTPASVVADVGSGTGILSELFLRNGNHVYGVEPNPEMRAAGERLLAAYPDFRSVPGAAEATALPGASVDFVTAGQAFHWFDRDPTRREFARILRPGGWVVVVWNERRTDTSPFLAGYERLLLTYGTDYAEVSHKYVDENLIFPFFGARGAQLKTFDNEQVFDFEGLRGRTLSASYVPAPGHPNHAPMMEELAALFAGHHEGGRVVFEYDTKVYYGRLESGGRGLGGSTSS